MLYTLIHFYRILSPNHNINFKSNAQPYPYLTLTVFMTA